MFISKILSNLLQTKNNMARLTFFNIIDAIAQKSRLETDGLNANWNRLMKMPTRGGGILILDQYFWPREDNAIASFLKERGEPIQDQNVDLSSVNVLNLCLLLKHFLEEIGRPTWPYNRHHPCEGIDDSSYDSGAYDQVVRQVNDLIVACEALEIQSDESVEKSDEPDEKSTELFADPPKPKTGIVHLKKVRIGSFDNNDLLSTNTKIITEDAYCQMIEDENMLVIEKFINVNGDGVLDTITLLFHKKHWEALPGNNYIYTKMYLEKDDGFVLSKAMLFYIGLGSNVRCVDVTTEYVGSECKSEMFVMLKKNLDELEYV